MKKLILGLVLGVVIAAAGAVAYTFVFHGPVDEPEWTIASYSGEVLVGTDEGDWKPATMKMRLRGSDRIRTLDDGEATLVHGESHVTVRADSELTVAELRPGLSDFNVSEGMVFVEARGSRIRTTSFAGHVADAQDAGFGMAVQPDGLAVVQVKRGEIDFMSGGHTERVKEGEQSEAKAGKAPSRPVKIPRTLFMNVKFPDADTFNTRLARVEGRVPPGTRAYVAGRRVETDAEGRFATDVELHEGMNQFDVTAQDPSGRERSEQSPPIRVDTQSPFLQDSQIGKRKVGAEESRP